MTINDWGFCDLSVGKDYDLSKLYLFERLGFNTIAINTCIDDSEDEPKKKKKKGVPQEKKDFIPPPIEIPKDLNTQKLRILQRITIVFTDNSVAIKMSHSENIKKYDLISVVPKAAQAFQYACGSLDIDIITFQPESRIPFKISRKLYNQAVDRGVFFELMYSPAIRDSTARKNIISTAHNYHAVGKSKNIIVSSGAENHLQTRSAHDVINLGFIFGLNSHQSLEAIRRNARTLILKAQGRRGGKHYLEVIDSNNENKMEE